jgi:hypothetical protein
VAGLVLLIAWHAVLGLALAVLVWAVGDGLLRLLRVEAPGAAYAFGLAAVTVGAAAVLARWWLFPLSLLIVLGPLAAPPRRLRRSRDIERALARTLPGAAGLAFVLGLLLHGPTESLSSHAYGDVTFGAARLSSAAESMLPFRDYLVAGRNTTYVESAPAAIGGALSHLPGVDPFLFDAAALPAFAFAALAIGFAAAPRRRPWAVPALLLGAALVYPSWLVESPPVALTLPLGLSLWALWSAPLAPGAFALTAAVIAFDLVLTKGLALAALAVVVALVVARRYRAALLRPFGLLALGAALAALVAAVLAVQESAGWLTSLLEVKFLPGTAWDGVRSQFTVRSVQQLAPALEVVGEALLLVGFWRARLVLPTALAATALITTWFLGGHAQDISLSLALVTGVVALVAEGEPRSGRLWLTGAAVALAAMAWVRDPMSLRPAFIALAFAVGAAAGILGASRVAATVIAAVCVVGVAYASVRGLTDAPPTLVPADHEIWQAVHERVHADGLVFTSLTGPEITSAAGWNYYPGIARRQVYLGGWADSALRVERPELRRRLRANRAVLDGSAAPGSAPQASGYRRYFAVLRRSERPPPGATRITGNALYAFYALRP